MSNTKFDQNLVKTLLTERCDLAVKHIAENDTGYYIETADPLALRSLLYRFLTQVDHERYTDLMVVFSPDSHDEVWLIRKEASKLNNKSLPFRKKKAELDIKEEELVVGVIDGLLKDK